jgi:hypothetical protein
LTLFWMCMCCMIIQPLAFYTVPIWAVLPTFRKYIFFPS